MTNMTASSSKSCRAALALNNSGVSLLERGYYTEAITAFKDSLAIMKALMNNTDNISLEQTIEQKLQACNTKLACMQASSLDSIVDIIEISPIDDGDVSAMRAALSCMSACNKAMTIVFPIRLRCAAFEMNLDLQVATVLYNVGLASLAATYASSSAQQLSKKLLTTSALRNLSMAHSLFSRNIHNNKSNHNGGEGEHAYQRLCAMLVSGLVLKNMFRLFQSQKQLGKAQQVLASLSMLENAMDVDASRRCRFATVQQECLVSPAA